jgi:hypothetical protein
MAATGPHAEFARLHAASGRTQAETAAALAARLERAVSPFQVNRWLSGATRLPAEVLDAMRAPGSAVIAARVPVVEALTESSEVVSLLGYADAAGALQLDEARRIGVVPIHPAQRGSTAAFAFIVFGDSLSPRLRHGDVAYAIRGRAPAPGQPTVIELTSDAALVRLFERADADALHFTQLRGERLALPIAEVAALHAIVGVSFGQQP